MFYFTGIGYLYFHQKSKSGWFWEQTKESYWLFHSVPLQCDPCRLSHSCCQVIILDESIFLLLRVDRLRGAMFFTQSKNHIVYFFKHLRSVFFLQMVSKFLVKTAGTDFCLFVIALSRFFFSKENSNPLCPKSWMVVHWV